MAPMVKSRYKSYKFMFSSTTIILLHSTNVKDTQLATILLTQNIATPKKLLLQSLKHQPTQLVVSYHHKPKV